MLNGEHGILNQAARAKTETERKSTEEAVRLATIAAMTNTSHKVNVDELRKELTNSLGLNYTMDGDETNGWIVEAGGETYLITSNGEVKGEDEIPVQPIPIEDYGKEVKGYTLSGITTGVKWKIFLEDGQNIYLIADNYIEKNNIPQSKGRHSLGDGLYPRSAYFNDEVLGDYSGAKDIVENTKLSEKYNKWAYAHPETIYGGIKAVAYMLDTSKDVWGKYANNNYAEYAIGGPTLEIFCESYKKMIMGIK